MDDREYEQANFSLLYAGTKTLILIVQIVKIDHIVEIDHKNSPNIWNNIHLNFLKKVFDQRLGSGRYNSISCLDNLISCLKTNFEILSKNEGHFVI